MSQGANEDQSDFKHVAGEKGQSALDRYEPVKIGFLGAELGADPTHYRRIHQLAFDKAKEEGWLPRNVQMVSIAERGLPQGSAVNAVNGFRSLVEEGCIGCKLCWEVCPVECFAPTDRHTYALVNPDLCEGCMACVIQCPTDTIVNHGDARSCGT